jgi:hypothetical protein
MAKAPEWPRELKKSISAKELAQRGAPLGLFNASQEPERERNNRLIKNYSAEIRRRTELILSFFRLHWPKNDDQWLILLVKLCGHWEIPAFEITVTPAKGPGRDKKWTDQKNCELFADVNALVLRGMSENAACQHIARNPRIFENRYNVTPKPQRRAKDAGDTLHRQYERVKARVQSDQLFRIRYFSLPFASTDYGPDLINEAIRRYAIPQKS